MTGLLKSLFGGKRKRRSLISEPINIVTGALGAGKTLFAIEQADLLRIHGDATMVYQVGINDPDLRKLPALPFPLEEWHVHADAGALKGAVIIVDEFHKWMPQRATGSRPPKFVEEMAEARRRGVRFILLTQSSEFDHFLKGTRLNRHFYLSRKAGIGKATIYEWQARFVWNPEENKEARAGAILHQWRHPWKEYGDWYKSADSHHFRIRIPLRLWLVPAFVLGALWFAFNAFGQVGSLMDGDSAIGKALKADEAKPTASGVDAKRQVEVFTDAGKYEEFFNPIVKSKPWSAPAYQGREVAAQPDVFCVASGAGEDALGEWRDESCSCFTEQGTPYDLEQAFCRTIAKHGNYNPYRAPLGVAGAASEPDGKADSRPRPAGAAASGVSIPSSDSPAILPSAG